MSGLFGAESEGALHVMTLNVRRPSPCTFWRRADRWSVRRERLSALLRAEQPTVLAAQEVVPEQATVIGEALGPAYRFVGHGRSARGTGEGCPIIYDSERLELRGWQQDALSERPRQAGSRSWGNLFPRIVVTAEFGDREGGATFRVLNAHFDHLSARSRRRSATQIRRALAAESTPAIVTGDFNAGPDSVSRRELTRDGTLIDAWDAAREHASKGYRTFARYRPAQVGRQIDAILTTRDIHVERVGVRAEPVLGGWASDHLPVQARLRLADPKGESS